MKPPTLTKPDRAEKNRRNTLTYDEQMREAEAACVPCKLCGGKAKIEDAGPGWGYLIGCENYGKRKGDCFQYVARYSGWAYNVAERWNELNALAPTDAAQAPFRIEDMTLADLMRDPLYEEATTPATDAAQAREAAADAIKMGFLSAAPGEWRVSDIERVTEAILRALEQEGRDG